MYIWFVACEDMFGVLQIVTGSLKSCEKKKILSCFMGIYYKHIGSEEP